MIGDAGRGRHADMEVDQQMFSINTQPPRPDPPHIDVDISDLKVGGTIRVEELALPKGVEPAGDPTVSVVSSRPGRTTAPVKRPRRPKPRNARRGAAAFRDHDRRGSASTLVILDWRTLVR